MSNNNGIDNEDLLVAKLEHFTEELKIEEIKARNLRNSLVNGTFSDSHFEDKIMLDFISRKKFFTDFLEDRIRSRNKTLLSLTTEEKEQLVNRMLIDESNRLYNNINNYRYFIHFLKHKKGIEDNQELLNLVCFKCNILMFLLDADYDDNKEKYSQYSFPDVELFYSENYRMNGETGLMEKDPLTLKGEAKDYVTTIRDAASHGEYYPSFVSTLDPLASQEQGNSKQDCVISIENSKGIPRVWLDLKYETLYKFVTSNLSEDIKKKYSFLLKILETDDFDAAISNSSEDDFNQMLSFMTNSVIQYNLEHHYKDTNNLFELMDLPMFKVYDDLQNGKDVTLEIQKQKILSSIKNAIGHNHVIWDNGKFVFNNLWQSERGSSNKRVECSANDLLFFLLNEGIYNFSITEKNQNAVLNKYIDSKDIYTYMSIMNIDFKNNPKF